LAQVWFKAVPQSNSAVQTLNGCVLLKLPRSYNNEVGNVCGHHGNIVAALGS